MIDKLPFWTEILFLIALITSLILFYYSNGKPKKLISIILIWSLFLSLISYYGFFQNTDVQPPRFGLVLIPVFGFIIYGLLKKQRAWIYKKRNIKISTFLHTVRLPVEIVLLQLFLVGSIPELMTFEGKNYDIVMGISAPIIGSLFLFNVIKKRHLLAWNIIGLIMIFCILFIGIFSAVLPIQLFAFEQPNIGINYFPFVLLPGVIVPLVIYTHITDILFIKKNK